MQRPAPPRRAPTSHDVARAAGVSQPTVSRALRGDPRVAASTRERVRRVADDLAYVPSRRGRSLVTRETGQVALVVGDLGNPFYMEAIEHLHAAVERAGLRAVILTDDPDAPLSAEALLDGSVDGAILATSRLGSALPAQLRDRGLAVTLMNRRLDDADVSACVSENAEGAAALGRMLLELGHRRIGAIFGPGDTSTSSDRERGLRAALETAGVALTPELTDSGPYSFETGYTGLNRIIGASPSAVVCGNDVVALGALNAAHELAVAVPEDLSIVGFDDIAMSAWPLIRLTTCRQDLPAMADRATALLVRQLTDPGAAPELVVVPTELRLRATHGPPAS